MGAALILRSQPKILRKIQKNLQRYISGISRFLHVCDSAAVDHCVNLFDCVDNGPNNDDIDANDHLMTFMKIIEKKMYLVSDNRSEQFMIDALLIFPCRTSQYLHLKSSRKGLCQTSS